MASNDWYPGATKRLIKKHVRSRNGRKFDVWILHVAVSEASSLYGYFSGAGVCSHFYVRRDGTLEQYLPISSKSSADYMGNARSVSIETQGMGSGKWTDAQLQAIAELGAWLHTKHGVSVKQIADSNGKGLGYHRLGVPGYMKAGTEKWSTAYKKSCPGGSRIKQVPTIAARVQTILTPPPPPEPEPNPVVDTTDWWKPKLSTGTTNTTGGPGEPTPTVSPTVDEGVEGGKEARVDIPEKVFPEGWRKAFYAVAAAVIAVAVLYGWVTPEQSEGFLSNVDSWLTVVAEVLAILAPILAFIKTRFTKTED